MARTGPSGTDVSILFFFSTRFRKGLFHDSMQTDPASVVQTDRNRLSTPPHFPGYLRKDAAEDPVSKIRGASTWFEDERCACTAQQSLPSRSSRFPACRPRLPHTLTVLPRYPDRLTRLIRGEIGASVLHSSFFRTVLPSHPFGSEESGSPGSGPFTLAFIKVPPDSAIRLRFHRFKNRKTGSARFAFAATRSFAAGRCDPTGFSASAS
ncbi:MAG: hypothetical protein EBX52_01110 [Proteobacteria bacterium]|nr:hypothetical protein [Pseudomonadota bacterium]